VPIRSTSSGLLLDLSGDGAIGKRLEHALRDAVRAGRLAAGSTLPSTRALARELGVSRGVVVSAYEQLVAEGYLSARHGASTRVAHAAAPPPPVPEAEARRPRFDLRPDLPDYSAFPRREWLASVRRTLAGARDEDLGYGDPRGAPQLRAALAEYLARVRGLAPGSAFVTGGFTHGLGIVCSALREQGARRIAVEDPGHPSVRRVVAHAGLRVVPVPVDADGIVVDAIGNVDAVLVTPAHQFPTGTVLSPGRRAQLLRHGAVLLEDDFDAEFGYDRPPVGALQGLAPEQVVYLGSTSRTLAPALRIGWAVLPSWLEPAVREHVEGTTIAPASLDQLALADFVTRGELDRHLRRMRLRYRRRRDTLVRALARHLPDLAVEGAAAGLYVLARLPRGTREADVLAAARERRLALAGMSEYRVASRRAPTLLLGYARSSEPAIREGVRELAKVYASVRG
jgi:GntR family transcriptional regulator/MocR family aminotransferase